jgi:hypothetical protein
MRRIVIGAAALVVVYLFVWGMLAPNSVLRFWEPEPTFIQDFGVQTPEPTQ